MPSPSNIRFQAIQAEVLIDKGLSSLDNVRSRTMMHIATDPETQQRTVSIFSDDGRGNGDVLFQFDYPRA